MTKRHNVNTAAPLTPNIHANKRQAADINRKMRLMDKISADLRKLMNDTGAPSELKNRFTTLANSLAECQTALRPDNSCQTETPVAKPRPPTHAKNEAKQQQHRPKPQPAQEEFERQRSIVMIGLSESRPRYYNPAGTLVRQDQELAHQMLTDKLGVETPVIACYRLGAFEDPARKGPRLLKVVLPTRQFQWMTLGRWKQRRDDIRSKEGYERLLIRPCMSPAEREEEKRKKARKQNTQTSN